VVGFATVAFAGPLMIVAFAAGALVAIGSTIATSTTGSSSLEGILGTRSSIIPIHTTDTIRTTVIPTATTLMAMVLTVTDTAGTVTVGLAAVALATVGFTMATSMDVPFTTVALISTALTALRRTAAGDSCNELVWHSSAEHAGGIRAMI
jgi:hypothetical protein